MGIAAVVSDKAAAWMDHELYAHVGIVSELDAAGLPSRIVHFTGANIEFILQQPTLMSHTSLRCTTGEPTRIDEAEIRETGVAEFYDGSTVADVTTVTTEDYRKIGQVPKFTRAQVHGTHARSSFDTPSMHD